MARALKKIATKKAKVKLPRKSKASMLLDEKHVGSEPEWSEVTPSNPKYMALLTEAMAHHRYFWDRKQFKAVVLEWAKKFSPTDVKSLANIDECWFISAGASLCKVELEGGELTPVHKTRIRTLIKELNKRTVAPSLDDDSQKEEQKPSATKNQVDFIAETEELLDQHLRNELPEDFSYYNFLSSRVVPRAKLPSIKSYYVPIAKEYELLLKKTDKDLVEGYRNVPIVEQKRRAAFVTSILQDLERYETGKIAVRKPRVPKKVPVEKKLATFQYQPESLEYKCKSVLPETILKAKIAVLFNTKTRVLSVLTSDEGFDIRGSTILNLNETESVKKRLRWPDKQLLELAKTNKLQLTKWFGNIKTAQSQAVGRCNADTMILKVYT
jgi:hypothetical protein